PVQGRLDRSRQPVPETVYPEGDVRAGWLARQSSQGGHQAQVVEHGGTQVLGHPVDLLQRLLERALDRLELVFSPGLSGALEQEVEADDLVGEGLSGLVVQLPGDPLPFPFL